MAALNYSLKRGCVLFGVVPLGAGRLVENRVMAQADGVVGACDTVLDYMVAFKCVGHGLGKVMGSHMAQHAAMLLLGILRGCAGSVDVGCLMH